jgi:hypothetical protein
MTGRIAGKVAKVTSDRELIINRGSEHGVGEGMIFRIKGSPLEVTDPDTGEVLGVVSRAKVLVQVVEVGGKFCIARTFRSRRVNVGGKFDVGSSGLSRMLQPPKWETRYETLRRAPSEGEEIEESDSIVAIGDLVELVDEEDVDAEETTIWR